MERTTEEANPRSEGLDRMTTLEAARVMNAEDRRVADAVGRVLPEIAMAVDQIAERLARGGRLVYVGTGTSGRLGILDASECPPTFGVPPELVQGVIAGGYEACHRAVEASEDDAEAGARDLEARGVGAADAVVALTASGATPYTIGALEWAEAQGAFTVLVACNPHPPAAAHADVAICPEVGPEVVAGSTRLKAGTAQKMVLNMLSTLTMVRLGYVLGNRMANLQTRNRKLVDRAVAILAAETGLGEAAARALLADAGGVLPLALVMAKRGMTAADARMILDAHGGSVGAALGATEDPCR